MKKSFITSGPGYRDQNDPLQNIFCFTFKCGRQESTNDKTSDQQLYIQMFV